MTDNRITKRELKKLIAENPEKFNPITSYGIIPKQPRPEDIVYRVDYDPDLRYLKLNSFVIQTFQLQSNADIYFAKLFKEKGWVKTITVNKPARAGVLVNNIKMPLELRNAVFTFGVKDTVLQAHTIITRERAKKFRVKEQQVRDYIDKCRDLHYKLLDANKRK
jgi:hypothetical protein